MPSTIQSGRPVYIVDGARTPQLKAQGGPGLFPAADLAFAAGRPLLARQPFDPSAFDEVVMGCVMPGPDEANIARIVASYCGSLSGTGSPITTRPASTSFGVSGSDRVPRLGHRATTGRLAERSE